MFLTAATTNIVTILSLLGLFQQQFKICSERFKTVLRMRNKDLQQLN